MLSPEALAEKQQNMNTLHQMIVKQQEVIAELQAKMNWTSTGWESEW